MQKDAFKPQGREISVVGVGSPLLGQPPAPRRQAPAPSAPTMARMPQQAGAPVPMEQPQRVAPVASERTIPRGAQEVKLAGAPTPELSAAQFDRGGASFQPSTPAAVLPTQEQVVQAPQQPALAQAPRPFLQRAQGAARHVGSVFRVTMRGIGPDGHEYASVYDAEFPVGTQPLDLDFAQLS